MAEKDAGSQQSPIENALFWVIVAVMIYITLTGYASKGGTGSLLSLDSFRSIVGLSPRSAPLTDDTLPGTRVTHTGDTPIYTSLDDSTPALTAKAGTPGTIVDGPVLKSGIEWWKVRYQDGTQGWTPGTSLAVDTAGSASAVTNTTPRGSRIVNTRLTDVYVSDTRTVIIGERPYGAKGTLLDRGFSVEGIPLSRVDYDFGVDGWVPFDAVTVDGETDRTAVKETTPVGSKVRTKDTIILRTQPRASAPEVARIRKDTEATLIDGPAVVDRVAWFKLETEDGDEGWTLLDDLEIDTENNLFAVNDTTALGSRVRHVQGTIVLSEPAGGDELLDADKGSEAVLIDGPIVYDGERWWRVQYADGTRGWVTPSTLELAGAPERDLDEPVIKQGFFGKAGAFLKSLGFMLAVFFAGVIVYIVIRLGQLQSKEENELKAFEKGSTPKDPATAKTVIVNTRWQNIVARVNSPDEKEWRLAILDADIMLDEIMTMVGYREENLGEKLKAADRRTFITLDKAWEAHLYRNKLAHEGSAFIVTQREARRIIDLYRQVFEEFRTI